MQQSKLAHKRGSLNWNTSGNQQRMQLIQILVLIIQVKSEMIEDAK
jgi:hypothetical protein